MTKIVAVVCRVPRLLYSVLSFKSIRHACGSTPHYGWNSSQPRCKYHRLKSSHVYNGIITLLYFTLLYTQDVKGFIEKQIRQTCFLES